MAYLPHHVYIINGQSGRPLVQSDEPEKQKPSKPQPAKKEVVATVDMLDIRVGQIVSVSYVEEIDIGEEQPRQVGHAWLRAWRVTRSLNDPLQPPLSCGLLDHAPAAFK